MSLRRAGFSPAILALSCALVIWCLACQSGGGGSSGEDSYDPYKHPGACLCYDGGSFVSCVVTADYQTCLETVTNCNPAWLSNGDCSHWCSNSPQRCP